MHIVIRSLLFSVLALAMAGFGQQPCPTVLAKNVRISNLIIESDSLPRADRERITRLFQQKTYLQSEIADRIQIAFRNLGYIKAVIRESDISFTAQQEGRNVAGVIVKVEPGGQYRLREIYIQNATIFPSSQLRELFSLQSGDLLNATKVGQGLENLRNLYATRGYVNSVASPEISIDESHRIIDLHIFVDEGNHSILVSCIWKERSLMQVPAKQSRIHGNHWKASATTHLSCNGGS